MNTISIGTYAGQLHTVEVIGVQISYTMKVSLGSFQIFNGQVTDLSNIPLDGVPVTAGLTLNDNGSVTIRWAGVTDTLLEVE